MASPQKENGYTPISNEILEKLAQTQISGNDRRILDVVIRKTYGFQKKKDRISLSQFVLATLLIKSVVCRGLNRLNKMNIIIRIANDNCIIYQFNKDFDTWKPLAKLLTLAKLQTNVSKSANPSLANLRHTKETITKENKTKDMSLSLKGKKPRSSREFANARREKIGKFPIQNNPLTEKQKVFIAVDRIGHYWLKAVKNKTGTEIRFDYSKSGKNYKAVQKSLEFLTEEGVKKQIDFYLTSKKYEEQGANIAAALSEHSTNTILLKQK